MTTHPGAQYLAELEALRLAIRVNSPFHGGGAYAWTEAHDDGDYVTYEEAKRLLAAEKARADAAEADLKRINGFAQKYKRHHAAVLEERDALIREKSQSSWGEFNRLKTMYTDAEATIASLTEQLAEARRALEPRGWFVKDDAYGWSHFDNEVDARLHSEATGGMILVGVLQIETSKTPTDRFAQWLNDGPKLAKAVGVYVGIKVSAQPYARATLSLEKQEGEA